VVRAEDPRGRGQPLKLSRLNKSPIKTVDESSIKTIDGMATATRLKAEVKRAAAVNRGAGKRSRISPEAPAVPATAETKATEAATLQQASPLEDPADALAHMMRSNFKEWRLVHGRSARQIQRSFRRHQVHAFLRDMERHHAIVRLQVAVRQCLDRKHHAVQGTIRADHDLWLAMQLHARREVETDRMVAGAAFVLGEPLSNVSLVSGCAGAKREGAGGALLWESGMHSFLRRRPAEDVRAVPAAPARAHPKRDAPVLRGPGIIGQGARPNRPAARYLDPVERQLHEGAEGALSWESSMHCFFRSRLAEDNEVEDAHDGVVHVRDLNLGSQAEGRKVTEEFVRRHGARDARGSASSKADDAPAKAPAHAAKPLDRHSTETQGSSRADGAECGARSATADVMGAAILTPTKTEWSLTHQDLVPQQQDEGMTILSDYELTIVSDYDLRKEGDDGGGSRASSARGRGSGSSSGVSWIPEGPIRNMIRNDPDAPRSAAHGMLHMILGTGKRFGRAAWEDEST
jgi:hypothetical protein